ncbi:MAG: FKBP-type peptidyl-prolyl cis-trans isomerase [Muribaculaceae bacterium]|nr:FKBP-type peptidyl-prolyl cis-trans isomerase [Muribaculaceae bacterium]
MGKHIDGTEFDSSNGEIVPFPLQNVVAGFREVITLMKPGAKAIAIIPSNLGYGVNGQGPIGPNETLVFELTTVGLNEQ